MNPNSDNPVVPLGLVAAEIGRDADELAVQLGDAVTLDVAAIRCVAVAVACDLITTHRQRLQAELDRAAARRAAAAQRPNAVRERVRALARQQDRFNGVDVPALAVMLADDIDSRLNQSARRMDELMSDELIGHRYTDQAAR